MKPAISVIIPVYRVEKYIHRCIDSVINQTIRNIEIILIDDGSPDKCGEICDEYARRDSRISVIHKGNEGLSLTRNAGIKQAKGKYIAFLDSDDYIEPNMYETLYQQAEILEAEIVYCNSIKEDINGECKILADFNTVSVFTDNEIEEIAKSFLTNKTLLQKLLLVTVWHGIYLTSTIKQHNIQFINERMIPSEDKIFHLSLLKHVHKVVFLPEVLHHYCMNGQSICHTFRYDKYEGWKREREKSLEYFNKPDMIQIINSTFVNQTYGYIIFMQKQHHLSFKEKYNRIAEILRDPICIKINQTIRYKHLSKKSSILHFLGSRRQTTFVFVLSYLFSRLF